MFASKIWLKTPLPVLIKFWNFIYEILVKTRENPRNGMGRFWPPKVNLFYGPYPPNSAINTACKEWPPSPPPSSEMEANNTPNISSNLHGKSQPQGLILYSPNELPHTAFALAQVVWKSHYLARSSISSQTLPNYDNPPKPPLRKITHPNSTTKHHQQTRPPLHCVSLEICTTWKWMLLLEITMWSSSWRDEENLPRVALEVP